jgi:1,6-anhydro-N-acetylmuramate kinase
VHNTTLMAQIMSLLPHITLARTTEFGMDAKGAIAFAPLAHETYHRCPGYIPSAPEPVIARY